jgi:apolipoprotein N-acyltransferase
LLGAVAGTALATLAYSLAFPPVGLHALAWVALVPFLLALRSVGTGGALLLGVLFSLGMGFLVADALPAAVESYFGQSKLRAWAFSAWVFAFTGGLYYMAFALAYRALARRTTAALPFLTAAAWTAAELGRGRLLTGTSFFVGNPWGLIGYSQADVLPLVQIASVTGVYGVGFVLVAVNAAWVELWLAVRGSGVAPKRAALGLLASALPALAALGYGIVSLRAAEAEEGPIVRVAVVQGDVDLGLRWKPEFYGRNLDEYLALTLMAIDRVHPQIIFWPEVALTFHLEDEPLYRRSIAQVLSEGDAELVAGGPRAEGDEPARYFNSVFLVSPAGEVLGRYDKQYLVPFSEYVPLPGLDLVKRQFGRIRFFQPGESTPPIETRAGPAGILICNEAMLPEVAGQRAREGATYLVNPSNDSWIARRRWARLMFDIVAMRAVEQRRYLVRASTSGPSAVVDPWGRVHARTEPFSQGLSLGGIRARTELSVYGRVGDLFAFSCAGAVAFTLLWRRRSGAAH